MKKRTKASRLYSKAYRSVTRKRVGRKKGGKAAFVRELSAGGAYGDLWLTLDLAKAFVWKSRTK